uniref:Uncharacterized protein n=1 Tax=Rhizophora mucronata TaxID=61149 RepID=A0A2P2NR43_RHIMU
MEQLSNPFLRTEYQKGKKLKHQKTRKLKTAHIRNH